MQIATPYAPPHYAKPQLGDWEITVEELAGYGSLIADEVERLGDMELRFAMDQEDIESNLYTGERGYVAHTARFVGASFRGRYLSPRQCAEILPREIRIEAREAAEREAQDLTDNS